MFKIRIIALVLLLAGAWIGYFDYDSEREKPVLYGEEGEVAAPTHPFKLGLDLSGGTHLVYSADVSSIKPLEINDSMDALRDVIERRVNLFGVAEPVVQVEETGILGSDDPSKERRLIVELPGVTDVSEAVDMIGATPILEFKKERSPEELQKMQDAYNLLQTAIEMGNTEYVPDPILSQDVYVDTGLTGKFLKRATLEFDVTTRAPYIGLKFNEEGGDLFAEITKDNIGKRIAIYLDGVPIQEPTVQDEIRNGEAIITGNYTAEEAKILVGRLNSGALPIDSLILLSTQTVGPSLGAKALDAGVQAGIWGLIFVAIFFIVWYRLPGIVAVLSLGIYLTTILALFKFIPVTLTAAGIAGFILSIGMAVDANVLIFERMKEELRGGRQLDEAIREGFKRAWLSIRDGNMSSIITAVILFWFGTSLVEGFALTFGIGIILSMLSAITVTRTFLLAIAGSSDGKALRCMFNSGFTRLDTKKD